MKLSRSAFALSDRDGIFPHIEADSPAAAVNTDERIVRATRRLRDFPESGRLGRIAGTRELAIGGTPCVAAYQVIGDIVRVLRVLHGVQQLPDDLPEG